MENNAEGTISRKLKRTNFTMISNTLISDNTISTSSKGLYCIINNLIDIPNFILYKKTIQNKCKEGERAFNTMWKELKEKGYLIQEKRYNKITNTFVYDYYLEDVPNENHVVGLPDAQFVDVQDVGGTNRTFINNTNINNTNINNNKEKTIPEPKVPNISTNKLFSMKTNNVNSSEVLNILVKSVVDHMNMRLGKHLSYKSNTKVIENLVNKDTTVTLDKIKLVIDWKIYDWYNSYDPKSPFDGTKYLTFDTLLRPVNFNKYISEMEVGFKYPENWNSEHLTNIKNSSKSRDGLYVEHNQKEADKVNDKNINKYMY